MRPELRFARLARPVTWFCLCLLSALILSVPLWSRASASTLVLTESVDQYNACFPGADTNFRVADAEGFLNGMTNPSGSPWHPLGLGGGDWRNPDVWDRDFVDSDINSAGDDNIGFDQLGLAFSMFAGHGNCEDATSQSCTHSYNCNHAGSGQTYPSRCLAGPNRATATCVYNTPRHLYTCGSNDAFSHKVDYSSGQVVFGESSNSGPWRGAGTNGGTNFVILDISCAARPGLEIYNLGNMFGGVHNIATLMPTNGHSDTWDSSERGSLFAACWAMNPNQSVAHCWESMINSVPSTEGTTCDGQGGFHGFGGCGANLTMQIAPTLAKAKWLHDTESWNDVANDVNDQTGSLNGTQLWGYVCNYNCAQFPPELP
jgi:hypothetical protein